MWDTSKIAAFTSVVSVLLALGGANLNDGQKNAITGETFIFYSPVGRPGSTYSVLHIVAYSPIFKDFVSHIKCATYCVLHFFNVI